jgi:glycosyltransferase involved in cell wall biosynthesis
MASVVLPANKDHYFNVAGKTAATNAYEEPKAVELGFFEKGVPNIVIAIPCYNEEVAIGSMVIKSIKYATRILVVDDGSTDETASIARAAGAQVIVHDKNMGKGAGIKDAFAYAKDHNADILVLIDGDGQHDPDEIPLLLQPILNKQADMVNGSRFLVKNGHHVPFYRRIGQEVLTLATNAGGSNKNITDSQNGFRAFARNTFDVFTFKQNGMGIESEMLMDAAKAKLDIKEVQINVRYDVAGSTYNPVAHGFSVLNSVLALISQRRPLLFFGVPGVVLLSIGMVMSLIVINTFNSVGTLATGYAMISILCIIVGFLGVFTGLTLNSIHGLRHDD